MTWKPRTVPREQSYLATCIARRLRFQMVCARRPSDRALARVFGVPYERIEWWRRVFGELQPALRYASLLLNRKTMFYPAYRHDRELQLGIEAFFLASFGITPKHPVRSKRDGSWNAAGEVFIDWKVGEFGPPDDMETVKRFVTILGRTLHEYEIDDETVGNSDNRASLKGAVAKREAGAVDFAISLKRLVFFLESKMKPDGVTNSEWMVMRDIIQALVDKGQLNADALDVFKAP